MCENEGETWACYKETVCACITVFWHHETHDSQMDRRTDRQTDKVIPVYPPINFVEAGGIKDPKSKDDKVKVTNLKNSPKFQIFQFWNGHYTRHTFWSCLIWCAHSMVNPKIISRKITVLIELAPDDTHSIDTKNSPQVLCWKRKKVHSENKGTF